MENVVVVPPASGDGAALLERSLVLRSDLGGEVLACSANAPLLVGGQRLRRHPLHPLEAEIRVGHHHGRRRVLANGLVGRLEDVGQVKHRAAVAAVHDDGEAYVRRQPAHQVVQDRVVADLSCLTEVHGDDGLVHTVRLVTVVVLHLAAVTRVMHKEAVARLGALCEPLERLHDVGPGGVHVESVVQENLHVIGALLETLLHQPIFHRLDVVPASPELGVAAHVVDSNQNGPGPASTSGMDQLHLVVQVLHTA
mmetsp:Transcript_1982/g.4017  ORF Transcript_1982/g.4017 Transcript_1982/m.4017 type:complete len:253 (+) Transcript_1982:425-1183(+)